MAAMKRVVPENLLKTQPMGLRRKAYIVSGLTGLCVAMFLYLMLPYEPSWSVPADRGVELIGFSSDGRRLHTAEDRWKLGTIRTRDVSGSVRTMASIKEAPLASFDFWKLSSDGLLMAHAGKLPSNERILRLIETSTGKLVQTIQLEPNVSYLEFSPNHQTYALGYNAGDHQFGKVTLFDTTTGKGTKTFEGITGKLVSLRFSQDGQTLVASSISGLDPDAEMSDTSIQSGSAHAIVFVFDVPTRQLRRRIENAFAPAVQQDGRMIVFRYDPASNKFIWLRYVLGDATGAPEFEMAIPWDQPLHPKAAQTWWPQLAGTFVVFESWGYERASTWQRLCSYWTADWWVRLCRYLGWGPTQGLIAVHRMKTFDAATGHPQYDLVLSSPELGCAGMVAPNGKAVAWVQSDRRLEFWEVPIQPPWFLIMGIAGLTAAIVLAVLRIRRWYIRRNEARLLASVVEPVNVIYRRRSSSHPY